jgi:hypothetical protein
MNMLKLGSLLLPLLLAACASVPPPRHVDLSGQCAPGLSTVQAIPLTLIAAKEGKKRKPPPLTDFANFGQCVQNESGRVAVILWKLQDAPLPVMARIEIVANNAATLAAGVTLLDSHYRLVRQHGFNEFVRRGQSFTLDVFLNPADTNVSYILLTPDAAWVGKQDETIVGLTNTIMIGTAPFNMGSEGKSIRQLSDTGQLRIELQPIMN